MKEIVIAIISAVGLGGLTTFFIKRHDEKKENHRNHLNDIFIKICEYNQMIIDFFPQ